MPVLALCPWNRRRPRGRMPRMKIGNGVEVQGGATVWMTARLPEKGWTLLGWTASEVEEGVIQLVPLGRVGAVILVPPDEVFATAAEARDWRAAMLEAELKQVRGLGALPAGIGEGRQII